MAHAGRYLKWCCALALGCVLLATARAQMAAPVRFTVFSAKPIADLQFVPRQGGAAQKVVFYPTARSPRYEYRGAMPLRFFDATSGTVVAEATIPPEIREPLLLFLPIEPASGGGDAKKKGPSLRYQVAVLDDSAARLGAGSVAIVNLSGLPLSGTVNKDEITLRAGLNPSLAVGRSAKIALRTTFNKRVYQSYASTVTLTPKQRALLILFPPFYKGSLEVQSRLLIDEVGAGR